MKLQNLPRAVLKLRFAYSAIGTLAILGFYAAVIILCGEQLRLALGVSLGVAAAGLLLLIWILAKMGYDRYRYGYDEKRIVVEKGVIFRRKIVIPICQIQDLHRVQGPIMLLLKLGGVEISTAGSNFTLAYLATSDADKMIDRLAVNLDSGEVTENEEVL